MRAKTRRTQRVSPLAGGACGLIAVDEERKEAAKAYRMRGVTVNERCGTAFPATELPMLNDKN
jgi:hypothetical protein